MNELNMRKQLLIAESELNRAQLVADMAAIKAGTRALTRRATSTSSIVASSVVLMAGLASSPFRQSVGADAKTSRLDTVLKGATLIATLWLAFLSQKRDVNDSSTK